MSIKNPRAFNGVSSSKPVHKSRSAKIFKELASTISSGFSKFLKKTQTPNTDQIKENTKDQTVLKSQCQNIDYSKDKYQSSSKDAQCEKESRQSVVNDELIQDYKEMPVEEQKKLCVVIVQKKSNQQQGQVACIIKSSDSSESASNKEQGSIPSQEPQEEIPKCDIQQKSNDQRSRQPNVLLQEISEQNELSIKDEINLEKDKNVSIGDSKLKSELLVVGEKQPIAKRIQQSSSNVQQQNGSINGEKNVEKASKSINLQIQSLQKCQLLLLQLLKKQQESSQKQEQLLQKQQESSQKHEFLLKVLNQIKSKVFDRSLNQSKLEVNNNNIKSCPIYEILKLVNNDIEDKLLNNVIHPLSLFTNYLSSVLAKLSFQKDISPRIQRRYQDLPVRNQSVSQNINDISGIDHASNGDQTSYIQSYFDQSSDESKQSKDQSAMQNPNVQNDSNSKIDENANEQRFLPDGLSQSQMLHVSRPQLAQLNDSHRLSQKYQIQLSRIEAQLKEFQLSSMNIQSYRLELKEDQRIISILSCKKLTQNLNAEIDGSMSKEQSLLVQVVEEVQLSGSQFGINDSQQVMKEAKSILLEYSSVTIFDGRFKKMDGFQRKDENQEQFPKKEIDHDCHCGKNYLLKSKYHGLDQSGNFLKNCCYQDLLDRSCSDAGQISSSNDFKHIPNGNSFSLYASQVRQKDHEYVLEVPGISSDNSTIIDKLDDSLDGLLPNAAAQYQPLDPLIYPSLRDSNT